jgi:hypothetical protein
MINKSTAIKSLRPNVEWTMNGDDVENIIWHTPNIQPLTEKEVQDEIIRLENQEIALQESRENMKNSAITKLKALGLTETEAKIIIGIE